MSALKLSFIIEAIDRATRPVRAINERISKMTEPVTKVRASFNSLINEAHLPRLGAAAAEVSRRFDGVTRSMRGIATAGLVVGAAGVAMWLPLKHVIDAGSKVNDTAAMLGVTAREFQRLAYALTLDGSSAEDAATALRFLQKNAVEAVTGNKEMSTWFRRAGMSAEFLKKNLNDPIALVHKLSDAMAKNISPAQRIALMQALLGRTGARNAQTLARGSAELKRLGDEAEHLGAVMSEETVTAMDEAGDSITRMERAVGGLFNRITAAALPAVEKIVARVTAWAVANRELIAARVTEFIERLIERLPQILDTTTRIVSAIGAAIGVADSVARAFGGWEVVLGSVAALMVGKVLVAIALFMKAIGALTITTGTFGLVLSLTPLGWFIAGVAAIAGLAALVIANWTPIKQFFIDLWEGVANAIQRLDAITPDWVKRFTLPGMALSAAANLTRPTVPTVAGAPVGQTQVGGTVRIELDQDGRARVASMKSDNPNVDFDVDNGTLFIGA